MIKNLWNQTTFICGCHDHRVEMEYNAKGETMFYSCPKYLDHQPGEQACRNNLSFFNAEKILDKFSKLVAENDGLDMKGMKFSYRGIDVKVVKYTEDKLELEIVNHKSLA